MTVTRPPYVALELAEQIRFDIIFIDAKLPAMNGLQVWLAIEEVTPTSTAIMPAGDARRHTRRREPTCRTFLDASPSHAS